MVEKQKIQNMKNTHSIEDSIPEVKETPKEEKTKREASWKTPEKIRVATKRIACDGGGGVLGHPKVWLEMGEADSVDCPYCDRQFLLK